MASEKEKPTACECGSLREPCYYIDGEWYCDNCMPCDAPGDFEPYDTPSIDRPETYYSEGGQ